MEVPTCPTHGFKLVNGRYIELMVPTSFRTAIMGVNDYGDVVGFYATTDLTCSTFLYHGFIWYHTNVVKKLDYPGTDVCITTTSAAVTVPFGINKAGVVVGGVWRSEERRVGKEGRSGRGLLEKTKKVRRD